MPGSVRESEGGSEDREEKGCEGGDEGTERGSRISSPCTQTAPSLFVYSSNAFAIVSSSSTHDATCPANGHAVCLNLLG